MHFYRFIFLISIIFTSAIICRAEEKTPNFSYIPNIHGTLRPRYELLTESGESRFMVRNARLAIDGRVAPEIDYFAQADLCAKGVFMPLDFWARIALAKGLKLQAGQFRMPFGIDTFRAPHNYLFSNRSFLGKNMCNYRAVGCKASYILPVLPLTVEAGIFNPYAIGQHEVWTKSMAWAARAVYNLPGWKFSAGMMSICPDKVRANLLDACIGWFDSRWTVEAEYIHEHYTHREHKAADSYTVFASYRMPVKLSLFNRLSFQGRVDGITDYSNCHYSDGHLITNIPSRNRITVGSTLSYIRSANLFFDLRLDFEKYFYKSDASIPEGQNDKIMAELILRF